MPRLYKVTIGGGGPPPVTTNIGLTESLLRADQITRVHSAQRTITDGPGHQDGVPKYTRSGVATDNKGLTDNFLTDFTPGTQLAYDGPIIWGSSEPDGQNDADPNAPTWATLKSGCTAAGGVLNGYREYGTQSQLPISAATKTRHNAGGMLVKHVRFNLNTTGKSIYKSIADGDYDSTYHQLFLDMMNLTYGDGKGTHAPSNSIFTPDSEFDRRITEAGGPAGTAAELKAAWHHLFDYCRFSGPSDIIDHPNNDKLLFGWAPTGFGMRRTANGSGGNLGNGNMYPPGTGAADRASLCCPPDSEVDIFTPDMYNKYSEWNGSPSQYDIGGSNWHKMGDLFDYARLWTVTSGHLIGKQILCVEGDCAEWGTPAPSWDTLDGVGKVFPSKPSGATPDAGAAKSQWYADGINYMLTHSDAMGWLYWNVTWPPNTSATALQGFQNASATALANQ